MGKPLDLNGRTHSYPTRVTACLGFCGWGAGERPRLFLGECRLEFGDFGLQRGDLGILRLASAGAWDERSRRLLEHFHIPPRQFGERVRAERALERRADILLVLAERSEEHTSELQSLMRISYAVFVLKKKN